MISSRGHWAKKSNGLMTSCRTLEPYDRFPLFCLRRRPVMGVRAEHFSTTNVPHPPKKGMCRSQESDRGRHDRSLESSTHCGFVCGNQGGRRECCGCSNRKKCLELPSRVHASSSAIFGSLLTILCTKVFCESPRHLAGTIWHLSRSSQSGPKSDEHAHAA